MISKGNIDKKTWPRFMRSMEAVWVKRFFETGPLVVMYCYVAARDTIGNDPVNFTWEWFMLLMCVVRGLFLAMSLGMMSALQIPLYLRGEASQKGGWCGVAGASNHKTRSVHLALILFADIGVRVLPITMYLAMTPYDVERIDFFGIDLSVFGMSSHEMLAVIVFSIVWVLEIFLSFIHGDWKPHYRPFVAFVQIFSGALTLTSRTKMKNGIHGEHVTC